MKRISRLISSIIPTKTREEKLNLVVESMVSNLFDTKYEGQSLSSEDIAYITYNMKERVKTLLKDREERYTNLAIEARDAVRSVDKPISEIVVFEPKAIDKYPACKEPLNQAI